MYRFGINRVILGTFDEWFDEPRMNEANTVSLGLEPSAPVMRTGAGFHGQAFRPNSKTVASNFDRLTFFEIISPSSVIP
jgi:hypothetical protein